MKLNPCRLVSVLLISAGLSCQAKVEVGSTEPRKNEFTERLGGEEQEPGGDESGDDEADDRLVALQVTPANAKIAAGSVRKFVATGVTAAGATRDLTSVVTWASSKPAVATVDSKGGRGVAPGKAKLSASHAGLVGEATLEVSAAKLVRIDVTPVTARVAKGSLLALTASGVYADGSVQDLTATAVWSSADEELATVESFAGAPGQVSGLAVGNVLISAVVGDVTGSKSVEVTAAELLSIEVTPASARLVVNTAAQLHATGFFSDGSVQDVTAAATWSSADAGTATIGDGAGGKGLVTAVSAGTTTLTAALDGKSGSHALTIRTAVLTGIDVTPATPAVPEGVPQKFKATGSFSDGSTQDVSLSVVWSAAATAVGTVSNAAGSKGVATPVAPGSTNITATLGAVSGAVSFTVTPATLVSIQVTAASSIQPEGLTQSLHATGIYSDASTHDLTDLVTWSAGSAAMAVSNASGEQGVVTAVASGTGAVEATFSGVTGSANLTVVATEVASIEITPADATLVKGVTQQMTATATLADASTFDVTDQVVWRVSAGQASASVSNVGGSRGLAAAEAVGVATIGAALPFGSETFSATTTLTVTPATLSSINVTPTTASVAKGLTRQFVATAHYSDTTTADVTNAALWSSSDATRATVVTSGGSRGLATATGVGAVTITATIGTVAGDGNLTVTAATLVSMAVTPAAPEIAKGLAQNFVATGTYTDGSTDDLTDEVNWSSADTGKLTISNASGTEGEAATLAVGTATVSAGLSGVTGSTTVTVKAAALVSVTVTPSTPSITIGATQQFVATGTYTDQTTQTLTGSATWSSASPSQATIDAGGLATGVSTGSAVITATSGGIVGDATLSVTGGVTLVSIAVTPGTPSISIGATQQFTATGTYSDSSTQNLTGSVTWTSSTPAAATVASTGLATYVGVGSTTVTATSGAVSGQATLTTAATIDADGEALTLTASTFTVGSGAAVAYPSGQAINVLNVGATVTLAGSTVADSWVLGIVAGDTTVAWNGGSVINLGQPTSLIVDGGAGAGANSLTGPDQSNAWSITDNDVGSLNGSVLFSRIGTLNGGSDIDVFSFDAGKGLSGSVTGGAGADTLDYSSYSTLVAVTINGASGANGYPGTVTGVTGGFTGIDKVIAGSFGVDTFAGRAVASTWTIDGTQDNYKDNGTGTIVFSGFEKLTGAANVADTFKFRNDATFAGTIDGSTVGTNVLDYSDASNTAGVSIVLTASSAGYVNASGNAFLNCASLKGTAQADAYTMGAAGVTVSAIVGGGGADTLAYSGYTTAVQVSLTAGTATGTASISGIVNVTGGPNNDRITGDANANILAGGGGNDILVGNAGDDTLSTGGTGYSLLIGGAGTDTLTSVVNNILVGGTTTHDGSSTALSALLSEWSRSAVALATRIARLTGSAGGLNGTFFLRSSEVSDDSAVDALTGGTAGDWYITHTGDTVSDANGTQTNY